MAAEASSLQNMGWYSAAGSFMQAWGTIEQGMTASIEAGRNRFRQDFAWTESIKNAQEAEALSQRQALEELRQSRLVESRILAVSASSGGGVSDPTTVKILSDAHAIGAYKAAVTLYEGESRSRAIRTQGALGQTTSGSNPAAAYDFAALTTFARGGASLYAKYGLNGPQNSPNLGDPKGAGGMGDDGGMP